MPINVPTLRHIEPRIVRDTVASFVSHLPIPQCLREYYGRVLTVVAKRHTCVRDVLCTRKITLSFTEIQDAAAEPCNCAAIATQHGLPLLDGHIMARRPAHLRKIFGTQTPIITQDLKSEPVVPWWMAKNIVTSSLKRLLLSLPVHSVSDSASELYSTVLSHVHTAWCAERTVQPWYCRHEAIEKFRNDHPEFVFLPMDKNESRCFACCPVLYYKKILEIYADQKQFEFIQDFRSSTAARDYVSSTLFADCKRYDLGRFWRHGPRHAPPHSFILPKCKMSETTGQWKQRVLFSYYNHPLRSHGRPVGRALSLLLREAKRLIPSTAILTTQCLTRFVRRWNDWFSSHSDPKAFPELSLFELDVCEMFPSLDRDCTLQAIKDLHAEVVKARNKRGQDLRFAVNKLDSHLDRLGTGYSKYFYNLTFQQVFDFCHFDVLHNDLFTVGSAVFRQKRGVAIGGTGSAQMAIANLFMCELRGYPAYTPVPTDSYHMHPADLPVHPFRYVDNLVGIKRRDTPLEDIQSNFEHIYGLRLQPESEGFSLVTLEAELYITCQHDVPHVRMRYADKRGTNVPIEKVKRRFPEQYKPNAKRVIHSVIPSMARNCMYYRETYDDVLFNTSHVVASMQAKGYPHSWWVPALRDRLTLWGVHPEVLAAAMPSVPRSNDQFCPPRRPELL